MHLTVRRQTDENGSMVPGAGMRSAGRAFAITTRLPTADLMPLRAVAAAIFKGGAREVKVRRDCVGPFL